MKKLSTSIATLFAVCFLSVLAATAQVGTGSGKPEAKETAGEIDVRVTKALSQTKTEYEVGKDGMYKVTYRTNDKRTQSALIASKTEIIHGSEMRLVFSFAVIAGNPLSQEVANLLLTENLDSFPNAWAIQKEDDGKLSIANLIYVPANADGKTLDAALSSVMIAADKLEERLTKKDQF